MHIKGAYTYSAYSWNLIPIPVDVASERVWNWNDLQFQR